jgi:2-methylcitrate dehydratase
LDFPKGDPRNPLSDREVEEKFSALAEGVLSGRAQQRVKDAVWKLEKLRTVAELMALLKADVGGRKTSASVKSRAKKGVKKKQGRK